MKLILLTSFTILIATSCFLNRPESTAEMVITNESEILTENIDLNQQPNISAPTNSLPNIADTVESVRTSVVSIVSDTVSRDMYGLRQGEGSGSGIIIDQSGLILTNNHVIKNSTKITVTMDDGTQQEATVIGFDQLSDLAVIQIPGEGYPFIPLEDSSNLRVGDWVIAIGNALALPGGPTVTVGVVSALGRNIDINQDSTLTDLIQTDAVINPGNSGGPLLDLNGDIVGINTVVVRGNTNDGTSIEGIGFAVHIETASLVAKQLIETGKVKWAWMGAYLSDLNPEKAAEFNLSVREGVVVQAIVEDSPSSNSQIKPGDIILNINSIKTSSTMELTKILRHDYSPGDTVNLDVFRMELDGTTNIINLTMKLGERP
ncbi:MAG TPA: peptidase A2 [Dehalococcoidia bacterium]|jgi:S1-C subfamily serine protease|nr:peptidase A2 [Dehalococcoidia bacterium]